VLEFTLQIEPKQGLGSSVSRRIRSEGLIPAVLYQRGEQSVPAVLNSREFIKIASQAKTSQVFRSKSSVGELNDRSLLVKEVQRDFIKGSVLHVDFQLLRDDEEIIVEIPLTFVGEALGVKIDNGILTYVAHEIEISCLPKLIPEKIDINIAELRLGESIHGRDIVLPKGVKLVGNPDNTIVSIVASRPDDSAAPAVATDATAAAATPAAAAPAADKAKK
jgi:large subunit ribosomal protein L25